MKLQDVLPIEIREYQTVKAALCEEDVRILLQTYSSILRLRPAGGGLFELTASSWVGRIRLTRVEIRIIPKLPLPILWDWLAWAYDLRSLRWADESEFPEQFGELDWVARGLLNACRKIIATGILKSYVSVEQRLPSVKGSWLANSTALAWLKHEYSFDCRYDEFTSWVEENQLIYSGLQMLCHWNFRDPRLRPQAQQMMEFFGLEKPGGAAFRYSNRQIALGRLRKWKPTRLNRHYEEAFHWLRLFWEGISLSSSDSGLHRTKSFLLDMNELYEAYVAKRLTVLMEPYRIEVIPQKADWLAEGGRIRIVPDLLLRNREGKEVIVDTKYKQKFDDASYNQDIIQMLAYLTARQSKAAVLLYAAGPERADQVRHTGMIIHQWSLQLDERGSEGGGSDQRLMEIAERLVTVFDEL